MRRLASPTISERNVPESDIIKQCAGLRTYKSKSRAIAATHNIVKTNSSPSLLHVITVHLDDYL